jgi:hypothetical protein
MKGGLLLGCEVEWRGEKEGEIEIGGSERELIELEWDGETEFGVEREEEGAIE